MKYLLFLLLTALACTPDMRAWDGDPTSCDVVYAGACWRGEGRENVVLVEGYARNYWGGGEHTLDGWLITVSDDLVATECSGGAVACAFLAPEKAIYLPVQECPMAVMLHEYGHTVLPATDNHNDLRWQDMAQVYTDYCRNYWAN